MQFLSPLFLWGLLAASIPVIIHLINRRRHQTIQWAAMQFLLKATRESRGKKKLRHILILACRCLAIAGLVTAAAKPLVAGWMGWSGGSIDTVVLLLDRSASMEIKSDGELIPRRQIILEKIRASMSSLGNPRLVLIDSATRRPQEVPSPDVLPELSATLATDSSADIPSMLNTAVEFLTDLGGRSEIWIASDLQSSNWQPGDERWASARASVSALPNPPVVRVLALTGPTASNTSIRLLEMRRDNQALELEVEIMRSGTGGSLAVPLTTNVNGASTTESLTLSEQSLVFHKRVALGAAEESGFGWVSIPADGNVRDNVAFFSYGPSRERKTLVVSPPGESANYLALSAAPPGLGNLKVVSVVPDQAAAAISPDLSAILWAAPLPTGTVADLLNQYLLAGGQVMFFPAVESEAHSFKDIQWAPLSEAPSGKFFILQDWNHQDGLLRDGLDGSAIAGSRFKAIRRQMPLGDLMPLARWEDGEPMLARRVFEQGTAWFMGSLPDYTWSNLGDADVLLPATQRMIEAGAARFDEQYVTTVGAASQRMLSTGVVTRVDAYGSSEPGNSLYESGVYSRDGQLVAINRPADEDSSEIIDREAVDRLLDGIKHTLFDQAGEANDADLSKDVWRVFLVLSLLFLLGEVLLGMPKKSQPVVLHPKVNA